MYILHNDRYWSEILFCFTLIPEHELQVKVTDLEILCLSFTFREI